MKPGDECKYKKYNLIYILAIEYCPWSHPFAMDDGKHCCKYYSRKNDSSADPICDGGEIQFEDPLSCCILDDVFPCPEGLCQSHHNAHGKSFWV